MHEHFPVRKKNIREHNISNKVNKKKKINNEESIKFK